MLNPVGPNMSVYGSRFSVCCMDVFVVSLIFDLFLIRSTNCVNWVEENSSALVCKAISLCIKLKNTSLLLVVDPKLPMVCILTSQNGPLIFLAISSLP